MGKKISYRSTSVRSKRWYGEGCVHTGTKTLSGPFQNRSRNWAVRKSEPEIRTIRYRTVPFSCEQKRYDIIPLSGPGLVSTGDTKLVSMTTTDVEVEIRPNCIINFAECFVFSKQTFDLNCLFILILILINSCKC